jgi:hypothetical protein
MVREQTLLFGSRRSVSPSFSFLALVDWIFRSPVWRIGISATACFDMITVTTGTIVVAVKVGSCTELSTPRKITNSTRHGTSCLSSLRIVGSLGILNASLPRDGHIIDKRAHIVVEFGKRRMLRTRNNGDVHIFWFITDVERKVYTGGTNDST